MRLIVRRVKPTPGSQLALFATYSYHGFITDRDGETLELEADHHRHAEIENAIRDLKYGVGLNHLPSGRFAANAAWLAVQVLRLMENFRTQEVYEGVRDALRLGAISFDAIKHLVLCRIEGRPQRLDLELYPYLPRVTVTKTSASDYMALMSGSRR